MKKINMSKRILALLLVLAMVATMLPSGTLAATGDLVTGTNAGDTGLDHSVNANGIDASDTISWPIKIYDYLNDGMLFEYSSASDFTVKEADGGAYGGGANMPMISSGNIIGNDYTISTTYETYNTTTYTGTGYAFNNWGNASSYKINCDTDGATEVTRSVVAAQDNTSPMYLHLDYTGSSTTRSYGWISNFAKDDKQYYTGDEVRYMVIVYKTNAKYAQANSGMGRTFQTFWAVSDSSYSTDYSVHSGSIDISDLTDLFGWSQSGSTNVTGRLECANVVLTPSTDQWAYQVIDMKSSYNSTIGVKDNWTIDWDNDGTIDLDLSKDERVAGIGMSFPVGSYGEEMDISHIAYFSDPDEAARFGANAVIFDNDPGEYLGRTVTMSQSVSGGTAPTVSKGWNFTSTSNAAWSNSTFTAWKNSLGMTTTQTKDSTTGAYYVNVTNADSDDPDMADVWQSGNTYVSFSDIRYVTIVYRTHGITSPKLGFWLDDSNYKGCTVGKSGTYRKSITASESQWAAYTFDLNWLSAEFGLTLSGKVDTFNTIGIMFPGFTSSSQSMDIAYIDYFSTQSAADSFGSNAVSYLNGSSGTSVTTTTSFSSSTKSGWNMGSNQAFTMLYASTGGGWFDLDNDDSQDSSSAGGNNPWSNGYYSYPIGEKYTYISDTMNQYRYDAEDYGYTVAEDIYLLDMYPSGKTYYYISGVYGKYVNGVFTSTTDADTEAEASAIAKASAESKAATTLIGADYTLAQGQDDDGDKYWYAKDPTFDMSQLDLGYTLYNTLTEGVMTAGLLKSSLMTETGVDGNTYTVIEYKEDTVAYIAKLLQLTLVIPERDGRGYNYNYVKGTANGEQYGYDSNGDAYDLAGALRKQLNITFASDIASQTDSSKTKGTTSTSLGSASDTAKRLYNDEGQNKLIGPYLEVAANIQTFYDAAYYLLHNLFVDDSYNQLQDDYHYLVLSKATLESNGKEAYVFDAGFTDAAGGNSGLTYDPVVTDSEGKFSGTGTIKVTSAAAKDLIYYGSGNTTTRFPFLPVTDAEGVYAIGTDKESYLTNGTGSGHYFQEDGATSVSAVGDTYSTRNYNYVMAANGEFVYHEEDGLFFNFDGDDDVYMFINGELVVDIGAAHSITSVEMEVNDYVEWARQVLAEEEADPTSHTDEEVARAEKLNLEEGGNYSFDFYYMERHGWGANSRIATNIRVTDPSLTVEKTAEQNDVNVEYGGVVEKEDPIEYNFKLTNTGNTKLYNLTFTDDVIGVTLDYTNGLTVKDGYNGNYVMDSNGNKLDAHDISIYITGYELLTANDTRQGTHNKTGKGEYVAAEDGDYLYSEATVTFDSNEELINFLKTLDSDKTQSGDLNIEQVTQRGAGLWVDATIIVQGIYYEMTRDQLDAGVLNNTVYVTATSKTDPSMSGNETLQSQAHHRVYVTGAPSYYQWAGHNLYVTVEKIFSDATQAAGNTGSQLHEYIAFFNAANNDIANINYELCDKLGKTDTYSDITEHEKSGKDGYLVHYPESGTESFYVLMYLKTATRSDLKDGEYAIVRVTIHVTDVEDSTYVLDYGLKTEDLNTDGELFKNDALFGASGVNVAKLMGISTSEPSYLDASEVSGDDYNRINYTAYDLSTSNKLEMKGADSAMDGYYTLNLAIPAEGKTITYNSYTGSYSLTDAGTVTVHAYVPDDWTDAYLYFWYDNGTNNSWPGQDMNLDRVGEFSLDIPDDVSHIIISNGTDQTGNLTMTPGIETIVKIQEKGENDQYLTASVTTVVDKVTAHVDVPDGWGDVYLYYWYEYGTEGVDYPEWPGTLIEAADDGTYSMEIPGDVTKVVVHDNNGKETENVSLYAGKEVWINVKDSYNLEAAVSYDSDSYTIHVQVPSEDTENWGSVYLYCWDSSGTTVGPAWPGTELTKGDDDWYSYEVSNNVANVIVNNGNGLQTADLSMYAGRETWLTVDEELGVSRKYSKESFTVNVTVPDGWENVYLHYWNIEDNSYSTTWPGVAMTKNSDGSYSLTGVPSWVTHVIVNNGSDKQTANLQVASGRTVNVKVQARYDAYASYSKGNYKIHASVPSGWGDVYLYYWGDVTEENAEFPGVQMTDSEDGWFTMSDIPNDVYKFVISNGNPSEGAKQTLDLYIDPGMETWITVTDQTTIDQTNGMTKYVANLAYGAEAEEEGITFTPVNFMDSLYSIWMAITVHEVGITPASGTAAVNINKEVQMYKKITVLPATVVYYEDDFPGITYNTSSEVNVFTSLGDTDGSQDKTQSVDQNQEYGQDDTYKASSNTEMSGGSLTTITINETAQVAQFTFKGTGFELIGRTNAVIKDSDAEGYGSTSATLNVEVYDAADNRVARVPVITEFDNGADGGTDDITQVPVIRMEFDSGNSTPQQYTVKIWGIRSKNYDVLGEDGKPTTLETKVYVDGLRIFQPMGASQDGYYNANENGATFTELRELILDSAAAVAKYDGTATDIYSGTLTWTEMRNGDYTTGEYTQNEVDSVNDYLLQGPNNEAYMDGTHENAAVVFYVKKSTAATTHNLQVAVRAIDIGTFYGSDSITPEAKILYGATAEDGSLTWKELVTVNSSTEQYYTINFEECPYDKTTDTYQVALMVESGMVSYTSLKYNGLEIYEPSTWALRSISMQMLADIYVPKDDSEGDDIIIDGGNTDIDDGTVDDGTADDGTVDGGNVDDGNADDGTVNGGSTDTDDGTVEGGTNNGGTVEGGTADTGKDSVNSGTTGNENNISLEGSVTVATGNSNDAKPNGSTDNSTTGTAEDGDAAVKNTDEGTNDNNDTVDDGSAEDSVTDGNGDKDTDNNDGVKEDQNTGNGGVIGVIIAIAILAILAVAAKLLGDKKKKG